MERVFKRRFCFFVVLFLFFRGSVFASNPFSVMTVPKSGTFLLAKLLASEPFGNLICANVLENAQCPGRYLITHFAYGCPCWEPCLKENFPTKILICVRDFRAVALSMVEWWNGWKDPPVEGGTRPQGDWWLLSKREQIIALLKPELYGWKKSRLWTECEKVREWMPLFEREDIYVTSFEKLIGSEGGGTLEDQENEILNIAAFLNIPISLDGLNLITSTLFGGSWTFRVGQKDRWMDYFDEGLLQLAEERYGDLLRYFGYET